MSAADEIESMATRLDLLTADERMPAHDLREQAAQLRLLARQVRAIPLAPSHDGGAK
jgi:hypothetical protein